MISFRSPQPSDWADFLLLAAAEGWKVPQIESQLFRGPWSASVRVLDDSGSFGGLVTAVAHECSGWIGNLIIAPHLRGRGYGSRLFELGRAQLCGLGMSSIWLTASELGRPIYERAGFVAMGRIERWILPAGKGSSTASKEQNVPLTTLWQADQAAWGENRQTMLELLSRQGQLCAYGDAVALVQKGPDLQIFGPWYSPTACLRSHDMLLETLLASADPEREIIIDLFAATPLRPLFANAGFVCTGQNDLMAYGAVGSVDMSRMVALASLGSMG